MISLKKATILLVVSAALNLVAGCSTIIEPAASNLHEHDHATSTTLHELPAENAPSLALDVKVDPSGGYNLHIITENFVWSPENASGDHVDGQGHAHIFLDQEKIIRAYGEYVHIPSFLLAENTSDHLLRVELVGNDHAPYFSNGEPIKAEILIEYEN